MTTTLYLAGPMSGLPDHNFPAFLAAGDELTAAGYRVLNPALIDDTFGTEPGSQPWEWYMRRALKLMLAADHVALLPGWTESRGAIVEFDLANVLGMRTATVGAWLKRAQKDSAS